MVKMSEELLEKSKMACENVAEKAQDMDKDLSPLEIKMMVEQELGYGLSKDEIIVLALTFRHIDNMFERYEKEASLQSQMLYQ